jgi:predicted acetyltransferase
MTFEIRTCRTTGELRDALDVISHYFAYENTVEDAERFARWLEVERVHTAHDDGRVVGSAGAFTFRLSVPGGSSIPAAGVTVVGVLPSHRRRGALTSMMRAQLDDCRARGEPVAYLWASEATIYGRFGYGVAARTGSMTLPTERTSFAAPFEPRGRVRLVDEPEALELFPPLYDQAFAERPGMFSRSRAWWETRRLHDDPAHRRGGPKNRALLELDGQPAGYALYTVKQDWAAGSSKGTVTVLEAVTPAPEAARELWRWLLDFDWTSEFVADLLPLDHPLFLLLAEPRRMQFRVGDGVWVRLLDVGAALAARAYADAPPVVLELADAFMPENAGRWRVGGDGVARTDAAADLSVDVSGLGSVYLGGFSFGDLVRGSRATEFAPGAARRADALFRTAVEPWCAEIF